MYSMIRNLESIKERRYRMFLSSQNQTQSNNNVNTQNTIMRQAGVQSRGRPMMSTNRRSISMIGISSYKSSGGGCGCGS